jgi:hypothetical protein
LAAVPLPVLKQAVPAHLAQSTPDLPSVPVQISSSPLCPVRSRKGAFINCMASGQGHRSSTRQNRRIWSVVSADSFEYRRD